MRRLKLWISGTVLSLLLSVVLLLASCKPKTPSQYIQPDDMEDILVEYHLTKAMAQNNAVAYDDRDIYQTVYMEAVLKKHGVTRADFDSSLVYYYIRADRFESVYRRVAERLEEQALMLGASEGEIGKYAQLDATGDTANIWSDRSAMTMMPLPPYNRWDFVLEDDSLFRRGDSFLMQFMSDFMYQSGQKGAVLYVAIEYTDTVVSRYQRFSSSGYTQMRIPAIDDQDIKGLKGFFYVEKGNEPPTTTRLLFLNNVQLIRFHKEIKEDEEIKKDSLQRDSIGGRIETDTLSRGDSVGPGRLRLSVDSGAGPHRVAPRLSDDRVR